MFIIHPFFEFLKKQNYTQLVPRPYDSRWKYLGIIKSFQSGFNPYSGKIYYNQISELNTWFKTGAFPLNPSDRARLIDEYLFLAHDFIHHWGMLLIETFLRNVLKKEFYSMPPEKHVFFLLLTEAMATVGLDYWILAETPIGKQFKLSENYHQLTISLTPDQIMNIKKIRPDFTINRKELFSEIANFYLSGEIHGFDIKDVEDCADLKKYIVHELEYGEMQRAYARIMIDQLWCNKHSEPEDFSPIVITDTWQNDLILYLERALWLLKSGQFVEDLSAASINLKNGLKKIVPGHTVINPHLVTMEKENGFIHESDLNKAPFLIQIYLSNINIQSIEYEDIQKIKSKLGSENDHIDLAWLHSNIPTFANKEHLVSEEPHLIDDYVFSLP